MVSQYMRLLKPIYMYLLMTRSEFNTSLDLYHLKNDCHVICKYKDKRTCPYLLTCHKTTTTSYNMQNENRSYVTMGIYETSIILRYDNLRIIG